jgi:hypothetical protein
MSVFVFTAPNGTEYEVDAPDYEKAHKGYVDFRQNEANEAKKKDIEGSNPLMQMLKGARDTAVVGADTLTAGLGVKALEKMMPGSEPALDVNAMRNQLGWVAPVADVAAMSRFPSAVPFAVNAMRGGPAARWLTGTTVAGAEGGVQGALQSAGHDQPAAGGAITGVLGGAGAQQLGGAINKGVNWIRGVDNTVPTGGRMGIKVLPPNQKNPSAADKINVALNTAESKARLSDDALAGQKGVKENIEELLRTDAKSFTAAQKPLMERIVNEDPATKLSRGAGNLLDSKLLAAGAGASSAYGTANPAVGAAIYAGILGGGRALKSMSSGGTQEAVDELRRLLAKKTKTEGPLSPLAQSVLSKGGRQIPIDEYLYGKD